ncbi:hypothetical protein HNP55_001869 [Paucibacter oligotrophus]|uniref:Uncharacterized protein n=1 Tax=Roseateles oligotrophus TaxID=1769250 RepID=A0A840L568_9BURK|nr:hypothetical protein [Roseateles oligotrophus]MBB4843350.1 hypothetical protein [Roseateles oligotrophus]
MDLLLSHLGTDMVLVGGQALGFWMSRFDSQVGRRLLKTHQIELLDATDTDAAQTTGAATPAAA